VSEVLSVELRLVNLDLVRPFTTSFGTETMKEAILVRFESFYSGKPDKVVKQ
jgi:hypothetical protein